MNKFEMIMKDVKETNEEINLNEQIKKYALTHTPEETEAQIRKYSDFVAKALLKI